MMTETSGTVSGASQSIGKKIWQKMRHGSNAIYEWRAEESTSDYNKVAPMLAPKSEAQERR
jgi:hypothetical protein